MPDFGEKKCKMARRLERIHSESLKVLSHPDVPEDLKPDIARQAKEALKLSQELADAHEPSKSMMQRVKGVLTWFAMLIPLVKHYYEDRS